MSLGIAHPHSYLGDHFSPVYLLLAPFYAAVPRPETLLVIQTLFLSLGVWPVYLLARLRLLPGWRRLSWALIYFLYLPLAYINLYDFHETALAVLPLGLAMLFLEQNRRALFVLSLLFTFVIKEEMALIGLGFGAYILLGKRDLLLGIAVFAGSLMAFFGIVRGIIPAFAGGTTYAYFSARYAQFGDSPGQILVTALTHPIRLAQTLLQMKSWPFSSGSLGRCSASPRCRASPP